MNTLIDFFEKSGYTDDQVRDILEWNETVGKDITNESDECKELRQNRIEEFIRLMKQSKMTAESTADEWEDIFKSAFGQK